MRILYRKLCFITGILSVCRDKRWARNHQWYSIDRKNHVCRMFFASHFFLWENDRLKINPFNHVVKNHVCHVFVASHFFLWENDWVKINPFNDVVKNHSCMKSEKVLISSLWEIKTVQIIHLQMTWRTTSAWSVPLNRNESQSVR